MAGTEVDRFRSLIGSAYQTDVYTSSLRLLTSRRRLTEPQHDGGDGSAVSAVPATLEGQSRGQAANPAEADAAARRAPSPGLSSAPQPPPGRVPVAPSRSPPLHGVRSSNSPAGEAAPLASAQPSAPSFNSKTLAPASVDGSQVMSSRATTGASARHPRYRRRHPATRIDVLVDETALCGSFLGGDGVSASPVMVAVQGSGRGSDSHHTLSGASAPASAVNAGRLRSSEDGAVVASVHTGSSVAAHARSGSSFVRLVTASASPSPSPSQLQLTGVAGAAAAAGRAGSSPATAGHVSHNHVGRDSAQLSHAPPGSAKRPPANEGVTPLSVSALVRRLEATMSGSTASSPPSPPPPSVAKSQRPPLAVHPPPPSPPKPLAGSRHDGASAPASAQDTNNNSNSMPIPNRPASVPQTSSPRHLNQSSSNNTNQADSSCTSKINSAPPAGFDQSVTNACSSPVKPSVAPMSLEVVPKHATPSPVPERTRVGVPQSAAPTPSATTVAHQRAALGSPHHGGNNTQQPNTPTVDAAHDRGAVAIELPQTAQMTASPPPLPHQQQLAVAPRLTREALMRQQLLQQEPHDVLHDIVQLPPEPSAQTNNNPSTRRPRPVKGRGSGAEAAAGGCRTTQDLLTRITVLDDTRGWRGAPDSSIVSTLGSSAAARRSNATSPNAYTGFHRGRTTGEGSGDG